jgi:hypothetical protein
MNAAPPQSLSQAFRRRLRFVWDGRFFVEVRISTRGDSIGLLIIRLS